MKCRLARIIVCFALLTGPSVAAAADLAAAFMNCTYLLQAPGVYGTAFVIGEPVAGEPKRVNLVMVTAAHLLESMPNETAVLHARVVRGQDWQKIPWPVAIRKRGRALWTRHPAVDLAVLRVSLPRGANLTVPSMDLVATDMDYRRFEIQPGASVMALGFPLAMGSGEGGFPVLRGGRVAGFPLTPIGREKTFLVDMPIFPGNSGGPVIMVRPLPPGPENVGAGVIQMLLGVVSREVLAADDGTGAPGTTTGRSLSLARVVHAGFIPDLVRQLPPP